MNRRNFLKTLGLGAASLAFDPERLLWVPGRKKIFIPNRTVNTVNFSDIVQLYDVNIKQNLYGAYFLEHALVTNKTYSPIEDMLNIIREG